MIIGSFLNAIYNRDGAMKGRALFLLDEVAGSGRVAKFSVNADLRFGW
ncbi:hypothetical protein RLV_2144 (plasmid) [Rhizobium leguminosarum bv. viciae]|nr:hypothetical protein RLV_2144 [Rhizobium leguminosarum bv. viciae]